MKHDCLCGRGPTGNGGTPECPIHLRCACGCLARDHVDGIGECRVAQEGEERRCHGCPEYRVARSRRFAELSDVEVDELDGEALRAAYRSLRAHHVEETTVLVARVRNFPEAKVEWSMHDDAYMQMLSHRNISMDDLCEPCAGFGVRLYSHGSTWRGGMSTVGFRHDICDECWGSGNREQPWRNLRTLEEDIREQVAAAAVDALARSAGATFQSESTKTSVRLIISYLNNIQHKKKIGNTEVASAGVWFGPLANGLANQLRRALGDPEINYEEEWRKGRKAFR